MPARLHPCLVGTLRYLEQANARSGRIPITFALMCPAVRWPTSGAGSRVVSFCWVPFSLMALLVLWRWATT